MSKKLILSALNEVREVAARKLVQNISEVEARRVVDRMSRLFEHSVLDGKCKRSQLLLDSTHSLSKRFKNFNMEPVTTAAACLELMQASFLVQDDIVDGGRTRRGRPCWHTLPEIGLNAINDALILDCIVPMMLSIKRAPFPVKDAFEEAKRTTVIGQLLDGNTNGIEDCTWTRHREIVLHKTSHYTFYTPIQLAALFTGQPFIIPKIKNIAYRLGYLFQCQDDFLDFFGDESQTGKIGTDMRQGKCTWVTCKALEKMQNNSVLINEFQANFGNVDSCDDAKMRAILTDLSLDQEFEAFCNIYADNLLDDIDRFPMVDLRPVLRNLLNELTEAWKDKVQS